MDYKFEMDVLVGNHAAASINGVAEISGFADEWHVVKIRITGARQERGVTVWRDVPLPANNFLHPEVLSYLEADCAGAIEESLCDAGRVSVYGIADPNAEHRLSAFELLGGR